MATKKCPQCKEKVDKEAEYCGCGYFFPAEPATVEAAPVQSTAQAGSTSSASENAGPAYTAQQSTNTTSSGSNDAAKSKKQKAIWGSVGIIIVFILIRVIVRLVIYNL